MADGDGGGHGKSFGNRRGSDVNRVGGGAAFTARWHVRAEHGWKRRGAVRVSRHAVLNLVGALGVLGLMGCGAGPGSQQAADAPNGEPSITIADLGGVQATPSPESQPTKRPTVIGTPTRTPRPTATLAYDPANPFEEYVVWYFKQDERITSATRLFFLGEHAIDPRRGVDPTWDAEIAAIADVLRDTDATVRARRAVPRTYAEAHSKLVDLAAGAAESADLFERSLKTLDLDTSKQAFDRFADAAVAGAEGRVLVKDVSDSLFDAEASELRELLANATVPPDDVQRPPTAMPPTTVDEYSDWFFARLERMLAGVIMLEREHVTLYDQPDLLDDEEWLRKLGDTYIVIEVAAEQDLAVPGVPLIAADIGEQLVEAAEELRRAAVQGRLGMENLDPETIAESRELMMQGGLRLRTAREALDAAVEAARGLESDAM